MPGETNLPPPINLSTEPVDSTPPNKQLHLPNQLKSLWMWIGLLGVAGLVLVIAAFSWYSLSLRPVHDATDAVEKRIVIKQGDGVSRIADELKAADLIRCPLAFRIYSEASGLKSSLQAGGFVVNSGQSTPDIVEHISQGITDEFDVTIIPGKTTGEIANDLVGAGFAVQDVEAALATNYDHPLFAGKPTDASLEGYIYPETYRVMADDQARDVLMRAFDEFERVIDQGDYRSKLKKQGLNLYQAITLASIVQLEVPDPVDQRQVAQVFLKRLKEKMPLGSDPTFKYAAKLDGVTPTINYDSPYNTRLYGGLPPGPIANFNLSALDAIVNPASGDYIYFVSGDDGRTHFSHTLDEHEALTERYCTDLCR